MEPLINILSLLATCGDLSVQMEAGPTYPTLMIRQGAGFYRCLGLLEQVGRIALIATPALIAVQYGMRVLGGSTSRRRLSRRGAPLRSSSRL